MKLKIIFAILFLFSYSITISATDIPQSLRYKLRLLLYDSTKNKESLDSLLVITSDLRKNINIKDSPVVIAYCGIGEALLAKYTFFPWDKLIYLNKGLKLLDKAVNVDSNNLEIRFLRFTVLSNVPSFLGYSSEANYEADVLYNMLKSYEYKEDSKLIENVVRFLIKSKRLDKYKQMDLNILYNLAINR